MKNVGHKDKIYRYAVSLVLMALGIMVSVWFYLLAAIVFGTAIFRTCLIYKLFNIDTNLDEKEIGNH